MRLSSRRLALATLFGAIISVFEILLPSPIDKAFIFIQTLLLSLGHLTLGPPGATYISLVGGLLTALWRTPLAPFTLAFALLYGLSIDIISSIAKVKDVDNDVKSKRLITAVTVSTVIVGSASYYTSVTLDLLPRNPLLEMSILAVGVINGLIGGYLSIVIWKRIFKRPK